MGNEYSYTPKESISGALASGIGGSLPALVNPYGSTGSNLAAVLGGSLLAGLFGYSAKKEAEQKNLAQVGYMQELLSGGITPEREKEILVADPKLEKLTTGIKLQEMLGGATAKAESDLARQKAEIDIISNYAKEKKLSFAKAKEMLDQGYGAGPSVPPIKEPKTDNTYLEKYNTLVQEGKNQGMTANGAAKYAETILEPLQFQTKKIQEKANAIREQNAKAQQMLATAKDAVEGAGETGGPIYIRAPREAASQAYASIPIGAGPERERQKQAKQALLGTITPAAVSALRSAGSVSDRENNMIIKAIPNKDFTPSQNLEIINQMSKVAALNEEYANALESYAMSGRGAEIEQLWSDYKKQEVFKNDKYNDNRIGFESWLASKKGEKASTKTVSMKQAGDDVSNMSDEDLDAAVAAIRLKRGGM